MSHHSHYNSPGRQYSSNHTNYNQRSNFSRWSDQNAYQQSSSTGGSRFNNQGHQSQIKERDTRGGNAEVRKYSDSPSDSTYYSSNKSEMASGSSLKDSGQTQKYLRESVAPMHTTSDGPNNYSYPVSNHHQNSSSIPVFRESSNRSDNSSSFGVDDLEGLLSDYPLSLDDGHKQPSSDTISSKRASEECELNDAVPPEPQRGCAKESQSAAHADGFNSSGLGIKPDPPPSVGSLGAESIGRDNSAELNASLSSQHAVGSTGIPTSKQGDPSRDPAPANFKTVITDVSANKTLTAYSHTKNEERSFRIMLKNSPSKPQLPTGTDSDKKDKCSLITDGSTPDDSKSCPENSISDSNLPKSAATVSDGQNCEPATAADSSGEAAQSGHESDNFGELVIDDGESSSTTKGDIHDIQGSLGDHLPDEDAVGKPSSENVEDQLLKMFAGLVEADESLGMLLGDAKGDVVALGSQGIKTEQADEGISLASACNVKPKNKEAPPPGMDLKKDPDGIDSSAPPRKQKRIRQSNGKHGSGLPKKKRKLDGKSFTKSSSRKSKDKLGKQSKGPYLRIRGRKESPISVTLINARQKDDDDRIDPGSQKKGRASALIESDILNASRNPVPLPVVSRTGDDPESELTCAFCRRASGHSNLGDLFGPNYVHLRKEISGKASSPYKSPSQDSSLQKKKSGKKDVQQFILTDTVRKNKKSSPSSKLKDGKYAQFPSDWPIVEIQDGPQKTAGVEIWLHEPCLTWASGVFVVGSRIVGLEDAVWDALKMTCICCKGSGANIPCSKRGCASYAHYICAVEADWDLLDEEFAAWCPSHTTFQQDHFRNKLTDQMVSLMT